MRNLVGVNWGFDLFGVEFELGVGEGGGDGDDELDGDDNEYGGEWDSIRGIFSLEEEVEEEVVVEDNIGNKNWGEVNV